ncbi:ABC transporter ATP-binding protein [Paenibacillaceae bacterium]|nr:ABC transporter ATP-binding protein [Paenibacillaceae bacterium]
MAKINYRRQRRAIEKLYEDKVTISRHENAKDPVKKVTKQTLVKIHEDQPCKLSQTGLPRNGQTEAQNDVKYDAKLFIAPEIEIKQGDVLEVTRKATGRIETYTAAAPFPPYSSHQEISLNKKGTA